MRITTFIGIMLACFAPAALASSDPLVVHEWGTFTSLQDESGRTIGGINTDDEPLPGFVHDLLKDRSETTVGKGLPFTTVRQEITMRLETPVMYFHLPPGSAPQTVDVSVQFRGGLLSQFYPDATTNVDRTAKMFPVIDDKTLGTLTWRNVRVGTNGAGPKTDSHVWLAPRDVAAANVTSDAGESERYLFYRGVGQIDAPIVAKRDGSRITFEYRDDGKLYGNASKTISKLWLAKFDADGTCHAIALAALGGTGSPSVATSIPTERTEHPLGLAQLRSSMKQSLVAAGLFDDEAEAMLSTWEKSYFKSGGLRLFYLVPRDWTDRVLPLKLSANAKLERVMIGRLEMVSPEQRQALTTIEGMESISSQMKPAWDAYASMGRFKSALILDEQARHSTKSLGQFINLYGLQ